MSDPREPGEIGWPANADHPHDPSVPAPGSGGAQAQDMPEVSPPTIDDEPIGVDTTGETDVTDEIHDAIDALPDAELEPTSEVDDAILPTDIEQEPTAE